MTWKNPTRLGAGLRTPTWSFLLSPLWRNKLGKSIEEVELALRHPDIRITKIPYKTSKHNPNGEPALWIQLGELSLYPVDEGIPELPVIANRLIRPIRCNLLQLYTLDPWADDPNPRFDEINSPQWMARFDADSDWPNAEKRHAAPPIPPFVARVEGGEVCPRDGYWWSPADKNKARIFKKGQIMPIVTSTEYGICYWLWSREIEEK